MEHTSNGSTDFSPGSQYNGPKYATKPSNPGSSDELADELDGMANANASDEDVESLIGLSISYAQTRLRCANTPATEKAAAMEEQTGYFDSDQETPPAVDTQFAEPLYETAEDVVARSQNATPRAFPLLPQGADQQLPDGDGNPSQPSKVDDVLIMPTAAFPPGAKPAEARQQSPPTSALAGVFDEGRKRSFSNSADTIKKYLPSMPSMAQVGNMFTSNPGQRSRFASTTPSSPRSESLGGPSSSTAQDQEALSPRYSSSSGLLRPKVLRRVTSDDSMLYHSVSRASSLGDDARFEDHHEQVNSRVKAIRDSLQDRSSFKMPAMPSLPSLPSMNIPSLPHFRFSMDFMNHNSARSKSVTDMVSLPLRQRTSILTQPKALPEAAPADADRTNEKGRSCLDSVMEELTGDIVIMGGYRGSILRSAKPPHRQVWVPVKVGLNIRKVNLEVGLEPEDEERMEETIFASGMLQHIGPVDISRRLFKRLRDCENARSGKLRVWDFGYDWRLSPRLLSRKLETFLKKLPSNQPGPDGIRKGAWVIAHSLGGLITRHVVNSRPELFSGVVYAGVPQSCINILGPLRNGDAVLLSSRVLTAQVNFTLRTSFVLLPEDGSCFVDINTKEKFPVDFFDVNDWIKYRLSPCTDQPLPPFSPSPGRLGSLLSINTSGNLLSLPGIPGKKSTSGTSSPTTPNFDGAKDKDTNNDSKTTRAADVLRSADGGTDRTLAPQMGNSAKSSHGSTGSISTAVTIPRDKAIAYLTRTLAETKQFKTELHFRAPLAAANRYPPLAVIYAKNIPTCNGAKVYGRESIPHADVYENLSFASGDGVCLARQAMLPPGYELVKGGRVRSDRGHVTLLGDLESVGRALESVVRGRGKGIGLGVGVGVGGVAGGGGGKGTREEEG